MKQQKKGCKCGKTNCLKKYCECFQAGVYCSELCRCVDCKNYEGSPDLISLLTRDPTILDQAASVNKRRKLEGEIKAERFPIPADAADAFKRMLRIQEPQWRRPNTNFLRIFDEELNEETIRGFCSKTITDIENYRAPQHGTSPAEDSHADTMDVSPGPFKVAKTPQRQTTHAVPAATQPSPTGLLLGEVASPSTPSQVWAMELEELVLTNLQKFLGGALDRIVAKEKTQTAEPASPEAPFRRLGPPAPLPGLVAASK